MSLRDFFDKKIEWYPKAECRYHSAERWYPKHGILIYVVRRRHTTEKLQGNALKLVI